MTDRHNAWLLIEQQLTDAHELEQHAHAIAGPDHCGRRWHRRTTGDVLTVVAQLNGRLWESEVHRSTRRRWAVRAWSESMGVWREIERGDGDGLERLRELVREVGELRVDVAVSAADVLDRHAEAFTRLAEDETPR